MVCCQCGSPKLSPAVIKRARPSSRCSRCVNASETGKAARRRYMRKWRLTARGKAYIADREARRIRFGNREFGVARTPEEAVVLKDYIRRRVTEFTQEQKRQYAAES